jgi:hypothetical protein
LQHIFILPDDLYAGTIRLFSMTNNGSAKANGPQVVALFAQLANTLLFVPILLAFLPSHRVSR